MGTPGARRWSASYDWERIGERLEAIYAEVVAECDARRADDASTAGMPAAADLSIALRAALDLTFVRVRRAGRPDRARVSVRSG